jgi:hypothetical protein
MSAAAVRLRGAGNAAAGRVLLFMAVALLCAPVARAAPPEAQIYLLYLRGYLEGLLDARFPGLELSVERLEADGSIVLDSPVCLGPWQRRDIERLVLGTGRVAGVAWNPPPAHCGGEGPPEKERPPREPRVMFHALPESELFAPPLADPRQPRFSMSYQRYRTPNESFRAASVALGEYFGLASGFLGRSGSSQIGIQAAVFALFNLDAPSNDLVNADYWVGIPLSYRRGAWSFLLRLYHQSSHLGDEFILGNPGVERVNLSYENLEFIASREWEFLRIYAGAGHIVNTSPKSPALEPWSARGGVEYVYPNALAGLEFVAAADIHTSEELDWKYSRSYQAGFKFRGNGPRRVRLMLEHYRGHSPNGQFFREKLRYTGIGLYFGF